MLDKVGSGLRTTQDDHLRNDARLLDRVAMLVTSPSAALLPRVLLLLVLVLLLSLPLLLLLLLMLLMLLLLLPFGLCFLEQLVNVDTETGRVSLSIGQVETVTAIARIAVWRVGQQIVGAGAAIVDGCIRCCLSRLDGSVGVDTPSFRQRF